MWAARKKPSGKTGQNVGVGPDMWHILPIGTALEFYLLEDYMPSLATCSLFVKRSTKPLEVLLGNHPGIAHKDAPAQFPPLQIVFDLGHGCDIHGIARQHPGSHRHAIAGDRQPNDE